jgi:hypothetical protein
MIIVIRGTNGSGKSHAVRSLIARSTVMREWGDGSQLLRVSRVTRPVLIIGPYEDGRSMGGCDCIRQPRQIYMWIHRAIRKDWHVVLEGVVLATRPYLQYHAEGIDIRYAFFNPPIVTCTARITERQLRKGHASPLSTRAMRGKLTRAQRMYDEAMQRGMICKEFTRSPVNALPWILAQLRGRPVLPTSSRSTGG